MLGVLIEPRLEVGERLQGRRLVQVREQVREAVGETNLLTDRKLDDLFDSVAIRRAEFLQHAPPGMPERRQAEEALRASETAR